MMERHRAQLIELLTNHGKIGMIGLDEHFGPALRPELQRTVMKMRELQPDVMLRERGIGSYGDYYSPGRAIPRSKESSERPRFSIYPLGTDFSYEPDAAKYKGTSWTIQSLADVTAKGGGLMIGGGSSPHGEFNPEAIRQMRASGDWLKVNVEAIYATRPRESTHRSEGDSIRYTRSKDWRFMSPNAYSDHEVRAMRRFVVFSLYAILTRWPEAAAPPMRSVRPKQSSQVTLFGSRTVLPWKLASAQGKLITFPDNLPQSTNRPCDRAWSLTIAAVEA
jgi:alpha-L-fucosidase